MVRSLAQWAFPAAMARNAPRRRSMQSSRDKRRPQRRHAEAFAPSEISRHVLRRSMTTKELPIEATRERAAATFNRWFIPVGAVSVHICIGSVYAWSTFNRPIQALFPNDPWWFSPPYTTFTTALVLLGLSAAYAGPWVGRRGPRAAATAAALFFGIGLIIGGLGLVLQQSVLVFLGMGVIGGIGCGLGYISPVTTLVKWFPDRRGMATGMAIMGFGGGAFLAGYLNVFFMDLF